MQRLQILSCQIISQGCAASDDEAKAQRAAETLMASWSSAGDRRAPVSAEGMAALAHIQTLPQALAVHPHMVQSPQAARLGGLGGWKAGWKGAFKEQHCLYGPLFQQGFHAHGAAVSLGEHKVFSAEAEFGLVFGQPLPARAQPYSEQEVLAALAHVELCIELCSSRHWDSPTKLHYVADGLLSGSVVRGPSIAPPKDLEKWPLIPVKIFVAGKEISVGDARNNPHDSPLASATFIVNDLCTKRGVGIEKGAIIITGHCTQAAFDRRPCPPHTKGGAPLAQWSAGDTIRAEFQGLGVVEALLQE